MPEELRYKKRMIDCNPIVFDPKERWIQMKDLADSSYYISDFGRVARLNKNGVFHEIKPAYFSKSYYVSIEIDRGDKKTHSRKRVGKLVLKYFVGGSTGSRRYIHINGIKSDCSLKNLRWRKGFIDNVDFKYLSELNHSKMPEESLIVKNYLDNEDVEPLFNLLLKYESLLRYKDYMNKTNYFNNNDYSGFCLLIIDRINQGGFKPNYKHKELISFKSFISSTFVSISYQYQKIRMFQMEERNIEYFNHVCQTA